MPPFTPPKYKLSVILCQCSMNILFQVAETTYTGHLNIYLRNNSLSPSLFLFLTVTCTHGNNCKICCVYCIAAMISKSYLSTDSGARFINVRTNECDSSDHHVSVVVVVVVVVVVGVNFFSFSTSTLKQLHGFSSNFEWMLLGWTPTKFVKIRVLPLFFIELWVILCNFWPILKKIFYTTTDQKSFIFGLERPHGGLVSNLFKLGRCDLYLRF